MNVPMLLKTKEQVAYLYDNNSLRQGLEKMRAHGYTAIPVLTKEGYYAGCVSEGDFLWHMIDTRNNTLKMQENYLIKDIIRPDFNPAARIDISMKELLDRSVSQNFIPIVDDRNYFIGIVTRQDILKNMKPSFC
ncbi:MAG: CBS domain-containing protein [Lachnospiraceae bacterium]